MTSKDYTAPLINESSSQAKNVLLHDNNSKGDRPEKKGLKLFHKYMIHYSDHTRPDPGSRDNPYYPVNSAI